MTSKITSLLALALLLTSTAIFALDWNDDTTGFLDLKELRKVADATTTERFPDADTVQLDNVFAIEYQADGKYLQIMDNAVKVMTQAGAESLRVLQSYYSANYSRAKISLVQILKVDGRVITLDLSSCTQEMTEPSQMQSNIYDPNNKVIGVSVANLQPGDTIRAIYVDETFKPRIPNSFADKFQFEDYSPILHTKVTVSAPKELPLKSIVVKAPQNGGPTFSQSEADGRITYTWEVSDVKQVFPEPAMPQSSSTLQRLIISTFDSWAQVSTWYDKLCEPRLTVDDDIRDTVRALTTEATDDNGKILALYNFVSQKVRYMGLTLEDTAPGYEPHDVTRTFHQRAGVCRDMAALLAAMLRCAGYDSHPALIHVGAPMDEEVPLPFFNHAITAVKSPKTGEWILMDPTNTNTMEPFPAYLSEKSYLVATPEGDPLRLSPVTPYQENLIEISTKAKITKEGLLQASSTIGFTGIMDNAYRNHLLSLTPDEQRLFFERQVAAAIPNARLTRLRITPENLQDMTTAVKASISYEVQNCLVAKVKKDGTPDSATGNTAMLKVPSLTGAFGLNMLIFRQATLDKRRFPLKAGNTAGVMESVSLDLPDELEVLHTPEYSQIDTPQFTIARELKNKPGRIDLESTYASKVMEYSPENYLELKKALAIKDAEERKMLILKFKATEDEDANAQNASADERDLEILDFTKTITLESPSSWTNEVSTTTLVKTYAGIEQIADAIVNYNPSIEEVKILQACVINGEAITDVPQENINEMDASWAASAPRYPAGKQLIINFPGVEVGSVVKLRIQTKYSHRPFFDCKTSFRLDNPARHFRLDIIAPKSMNLKPEFFADGWLEMQNDLPKPVKVRQKKEKLPDNMFRFSYEADDVPPTHSESNLPPAYTYLPTLVCSTGDWSTYASDLKNYISMALEPSQEISRFAKTLMADTPEETVTAIRDWIEKNIRTVGPSLNELPLSCLSAPKTTLKDGYGNSIDVALLYKALLDACDIYSELNLATSSPKEEELQRFYRMYPTLSLFDDCIVKANVNGKDIWLNDQSHYAHLGTSAYDRCMLLSTENGKIRIPDLPSALRDESNSEWRMDIQDDGAAVISITHTIQGTDFGTENRFYQQLTPEERRRHYIKLVSGIAQDATPVTPDMTTDFSKYPGTISYTVRIPNCASFDGDFCYLRLPITLGTPLNFTRTDRQFHPFRRGEYTRETRVINLRVPAKYPNVLLAPPDFLWRTPDGKGSIAWRNHTTTPEFGMRREYQFVYSVNLAPAITPVRLFQDYQKAYRTLTHPNARTLLLSK